MAKEAISPRQIISDTLDGFGANHEAFFRREPFLRTPFLHFTHVSRKLIPHAFVDKATPAAVWVDSS